MVHIGMCWAVDWEVVEEWLSKKYEYVTDTVTQCDNGHIHKGKFCSECGSPIKKLEVQIKNKEFEPHDFICEWGFTFNEDSSNIYYPIQNLKGHYFGLHQSFIDNMRKSYEKDISTNDKDFHEFVAFLATEDEPELCIYDDGYYNREWSTY